ncbi:aryl hydrocarbon receptor nuclear translocator-like 1b [Scomber scombrus]|uniref:Aryl hydrocarbon receptor nuclear translocator-like 1b n=1 Tax=Scomber scombrus TaxID=13677 RepID=A0AAV1N6E2_SCOSC
MCHFVLLGAFVRPQRVICHEVTNEAPVYAVLQPKDMLISKWSQYQLQHFSFDGVFSRVALCQDLCTKDSVAINILNKKTNASQEPNREAADGFLFVVDCDRGKILFVSESVDNILNYSKNDLIGESLFDYLHPKDIAKVKEQLSSADIMPGERCINAKSERKGFFTIHNTGYLKSWSPSEVDLDENNQLDIDGCHSSCLVAVGRLHPHTVSQPAQYDIRVKPMEFISRHAIDGKFVFVDQRANAILAYLPQELLGTSFYEYFHEDDIAHLAECHWQDAMPDLHTVPGTAGVVGESAGKIGRMIAAELLGIQRMDISTVISNSQRVSEASATLENLVEKGTEKEQDKQAEDFSTTQDVKTSEDVFEVQGLQKTLSLQDRLR